MASTQANLHQFYKARKSARDASNIKNIKNSIVRSHEVKGEKGLPVSDREIAVKTSDDDGCKIPTASEEVKFKVITNSGPTKSSKSTNRKAQVKSSRPAGSQNIADIFQRVAAKRKRQEEEEEDLETEIADDKGAGTSSLEHSHVTPPVTPKRKKDEDEEEKRKRRKQVNEGDGLDRTPRGPESILPPDAPKSAKKQLIMGSRISAELKENVEQEIKEVPKELPRKVLSPRKLTPQEIKEHLGKCGRLDQLRAKLLKVNQCGEKLRQFKEKTLVEQLRSAETSSPIKGAPHPQLEKFSALDVEVPISPRKTPIKTPVKTPVKAPAHERYQHLIGKPSEELVLPYKYRFVKEVFRAVDTVVSLLHNRQEVITFSKLKSAVQEMLRKAFHERHLGEIKSVFPLAYIFKQEIAKNTGRSVVKEGPKAPYELTLSANLEYKAAAQNLVSRFDMGLQTPAPKYRKMDSVVMVERRNIFHNSLIDILRDHHTEFLKSLDPPILNCNTNIKRWHPSFPLEDIPDIEPAPLPQPPASAETFGTASGILSKAQDMFSVNPRLEKAVVDAAAKTPTKAAPETASPQPAQPANVIAALKGISNSLLEKIRAREAAKAARDMTRTSGENKELAMLSRLPEISRIIRNIFVTEKKPALPWELVASKVAASYPSMLAGNEVDKHLNLLIKEIPGWCTVHKVRSGVFLKVDKNEPQSNINDKLQAVIKQRR